MGVTDASFHEIAPFLIGQLSFESSQRENRDVLNYRNSLNVMRPLKIVVLKRLSHLSERGNPLDDATPSFISDSSSCILGLSNKVYNISVVQGVPEKMAKTFD